MENPSVTIHIQGTIAYVYIPDGHAQPGDQYYTRDAGEWATLRDPSTLIAGTPVRRAIHPVATFIKENPEAIYKALERNPAAMRELVSDDTPFKRTLPRFHSGEAAPSPLPINPNRAEQIEHKFNAIRKSLADGTVQVDSIIRSLVSTIVDLENGPVVVNREAVPEIGSRVIGAEPMPDSVEEMVELELAGLNNELIEPVLRDLIRRRLKVEKGFAVTNRALNRVQEELAEMTARFENACRKFVLAWQIVTGEKAYSPTQALHPSFENQEINAFNDVEAHKIKGERGKLQKLKNDVNVLIGTNFPHLLKFISKQVHETAVSKGWWETDRNEGEILMLIVGEIAEGHEWLRKGNPPSDHIVGFSGVEEELADAVIRIMDYSHKFGHRLAEAILVKMEFNKTRPYKHGKKC